MSQASLSLIHPVNHLDIWSHTKTQNNDTALKLPGTCTLHDWKQLLLGKKLPLKPEDAEIKVLVTSPRCKNDNILARAKLAAIRKDYIVEKKDWRSPRIFLKVGNTTIYNVEIDVDTLETLPNMGKSQIRYSS